MLNKTVIFLAMLGVALLVAFATNAGRGGAVEVDEHPGIRVRDLEKEGREVQEVAMCNRTCDQVSSGNDIMGLCKNGKFPVCHVASATVSQTRCVDDVAWLDSSCNAGDVCGPCRPRLTPRSASINVDGDASEWTEDDFTANMYNQGNGDSTWKGYTVAAKAYTRVNCEEPQTICILVMAEPGYYIADSLADSWIKDYEAGLSNDKYEVVPPGVKFVQESGATIGWEGCFYIPDGAESGRNSIEIHANFGSWGNPGDTASTGKQTGGEMISLELCSDEPVDTPTEVDPVPTEADPVPTEADPTGDIDGSGNTGGEPTTPTEEPPAPTEEPPAPTESDPVPPPPEPESTPTEPTGDIGGSGNTGGEGGGGYGDPHVKTWTGHVYDFHGACDLVLAKSEHFNNGQGFVLHIRTHIRRNWSFIKEAALQIGNDVLQIGTRGIYHMNGHTGAKLVHSTTLPQTVGGFKINYVNFDSKRHKFEVDMGEFGIVSFKVYNEFLAVSVLNAHEHEFGDAVGLMGHFGSGKLLTRDGHEAKDATELGLDWQVRDTDPMLFHSVEGPQYPQKCTLPAPGAAIERRRLSESGITYHQAEMACENWGDEGKEACIFDVMETGDLSMAAHAEL